MGSISSVMYWTSGRWWGQEDIGCACQMPTRGGKEAAFRCSSFCVCENKQRRRSKIKCSFLQHHVSLWHWLCPCSHNLNDNDNWPGIWCNVGFTLGKSTTVKLNSNFTGPATILRLIPYTDFLLDLMIEKMC